MGKYVTFAFKGEPMCFIHVLLNAMDLAAKGHEARIVMEGEAVTLIKTLTESGDPLFKKAREQGLIDSVCKACSNKLGVLSYNEASGIPLKGDMSGHPSFAAFLEAGYTLITL